MNNKRTSSKITRKELVRRLMALDHPVETSTEVNSDLAARLQSLAIASSMGSASRPVRYIRRSRVSVAGWVVAGVIVASLSLASVNQLPDPLQVAMSNMLKAVGINVPHPEDKPIRVRQNNLEPTGSTLNP